jgi:hypothetical protein
MWDVGGGMLDVGCGMWDVGCWRWDVRGGMWEDRDIGFYLCRGRQGGKTKVENFRK